MPTGTTPPPGAVPPGGPQSSGLPRPASVRASFLSKLTPFQSRTVSVVPYAPERLSISQEAMTPAMAEAIIQAGIQAEKRASRIALENERAEQQQPNTLFAALKIRRALRRPKSGKMAEPEEKVDEAKANLDRHMKVLSRYKVRRVDFIDPEGATMKNLGWFMVNPHSTLFKMWQLGTLLLIIYQSFLLPYGLAFGGNDSNTMDIFTSCVFAWDIGIQFNIPIAPANEGDEYITNRRQIATTYARGCGAGNLNILGLLKALRVPRLLRLVRLLRVIKIFKIRPELRRWLQYSRHANLLRLIRLVLSFLAINHYVACIWYGAVASAETKAQDSSTDSLHLYFASYCTSILVVMEQNITIYDDNEYVFCILMMVMGAVLMAVVFGNVAILIANYYESQSNHQKKMEWLLASMNRMKLPNDLQNRINDYYQAMWERHGTLDGAVTAFVPELSRNLAYEVELFLRMDMINRAPIFQNCSAKVSGRSLSSLIPDSDPYANEIVLKVLSQGDYFGEIALLMNCKRTANVRAQGFSELCTLTREVFESISLRYLEDRNIIEKFIMDKYDPGMLQAAMKQSQEVTMRTGAAASRATLDSQALSENKILDMLRKIDVRLHRLEHRIDREARERHDSDIRFQMELGRHSTGSPHNLSVSSPSVPESLVYEPERVSMRNLFSQVPRADSSASQRAKSPKQKVVDGVATPENIDEKKVWKRLALSRPGSWRNTRREGSIESLRLRGLVKPGTASHHSSRGSSINATMSADLLNEPSLRDPCISPQVDEEADRFDTGALLSDLASRLTHIEHRHDEEHEEHSHESG
ncbi:Voltage-gated ion channel, partial [Globisporangium splendens]